MERPTINPWRRQAQFAYSQAVGVSGAERVLFCAGQRSVDADGRPLHPGDMRAQLNQALDNLQAILAAVGWSLSDVVRLNYYTTDVDQLYANWDVVETRVAQGASPPVGTLVGVSRLVLPDLLVEIEATAVR